MSPEKMEQYNYTIGLEIRKILLDMDEELFQEDLYLEYSEYNFENENQQAFLDAAHFYGIG